MSSLQSIFDNTFKNECKLVRGFVQDITFNKDTIRSIDNRSKQFLRYIRNSKNHGIEHFCLKYNLNYNESCVIISLIENLDRIPDYKTELDIFVDKFANKNWKKFLGIRGGFLPNASALGLYLLSLFISLKQKKHIVPKLIYKIGEPIAFIIFSKVAKVCSNQFFFADNIRTGLAQSRKYQDYRLMFGFMGYPVVTFRQADTYYRSYVDAIDHITHFCSEKSNMYLKPSITLRLSTLYPRFEYCRKNS